MNINDVAKSWKVQKTAPAWDTYESTQVTVEMAKRMAREVNAKETFGNNTRGNENGTI